MKYLYVSLIAILLLILSCSKEDDPEVIPTIPVVDSCFIVKPYTDQLPNFDFEEWGNPESSGGKFEEPCGGIWATGNGGSALTGTIITQKDTDAQNGTYAAKLVTKRTFGNILAAGSIFTGRFELNLSEPIKSAILGIPFTEKPKSMDGYYKYTSVNADSAQIMVLLTKYNSVDKNRDTVGYGLFVEYNTITAYTAYSALIDYNYSASASIPDTVVVSYTSSKGASEKEFKGEVGSTLFVDNGKFIY